MASRLVMKASKYLVFLANTKYKCVSIIKVLKYGKKWICTWFLSLQLSRKKSLNKNDVQKWMKFLSFLVGESSFSFPQFVPLGYILVRLDAVKKGLLLPCQFNLIDSLWYSGKHPHLVAVVGNVSIFLDTKWFLWAATTPLQQYYDI